MTKINKYSIAMIAVLAFSFLIRTFLIFKAPVIEEEKKNIAMAQTISLSGKNTNLVYRDSLSNHPLLAVYLTKLGAVLLGHNKIGYRLLFFAFGILSTLCIYLLAAKTIGRAGGILALMLSSFNLFHLGRSLMAVDEIIMLFFASLCLLIFFDALKHKKYNLLILCGICISLGYLADMKIALLIPIILIYLVIYKRDVLMRKETLFMLLLPVAVVCFDIYFLFRTNLKIGAFADMDMGISATGINFYLVRLISFVLGSDYRSIISWEIPSMSVLDGLAIIFGVFYSIKYRQDEVIKFMLIAFFLPVTVMTFLPKGEFWWSDISFWPGIYLASFALSNIWQKGYLYKFFTGALLLIIVSQPFYFMANIKNLNIPPNRYEKYVDFDMDLMQWYFKKGLLKEAIVEAREALDICPNETRIKGFLQECLNLQKKGGAKFY